MTLIDGQSKKKIFFRVNFNAKCKFSAGIWRSEWRAEFVQLLRGGRACM